MNVSISPSAPPPRAKSRSMGVKLIVVCVLALLMMIPALFVNGLVEDRTSRAAGVVEEISSRAGGRQTFLGPTLAIPYRIPPKTPQESAARGVYLVFPAQGSAAVKVTTEERRRSLFKVPVYQADLKFDAAFDLAGVPSDAPQGAELNWKGAEIIVGVSDARGALADATLTMGGADVTLVPAQVAPILGLGTANTEHRLRLLGAKATGIAAPDARFDVSSTLRFSGAERIAVLPYAKSTRVTMQGDWPSPGFDGGLLPVTRTVAKNGFSGEWNVPFIARGVNSEGSGDALAGLDAAALGVSLVEVADPYQSVTRSLKYAPLFLGLVFLSYFVFEITSGKRVHSAQYILVGTAQVIFYLLLLSLAERIGFDFGFLAGGGATVALLAANAGWVFASRLEGWRALGAFSLLYFLIYLLLRLEDNALLVGAIASFLAVAAVMYFTRGIDWYAGLPAARGGNPQTVPPLPQE